MKCGLRMTLVLPGSNGCHGWGTRLSSPTGLLLSRYCLGFAMESVPFPCPCVPPREKSSALAPQSLEHPLRCSSTPAARTRPPRHRLQEPDGKSSKPQRCVIVLSAFKPCRMSLCHNFSSLGGAGKTL